MGEIKFRAWNKVWGMMSLVDKIEFEEGKPVSVSVTIEATDFDHTDEWSDYEVGDDIILQQFTGLLDKNGKEIYEGDIISDNKTLKTTELGFISCEVIYEKELACFSVVTLSANKKERYIMPIHALELYIIPNKYEVIGNILSNPELLN